MKKKRIIILIVLLVIGFASVSTTLILNGTLNIGFNTKDFDVYFSDATLNGESKKSEFISSDGKTLNFTTNELSIIGEQAVVYYEVTNASKDYDANVKLICDDFSNEYVSVTNVLNSEVIEAQSSSDGILVAELIKASSESQQIELTCRISAEPVSRDSSADEPNPGDINTYSLYGYYVDSSDTIIANANLVVYSDTPHFTKTDNRGYFYVDGLEKGSHEIYNLGSQEYSEELSKEDVKRLAISNSNFTTSSGNIIFKDNSRIKDLVVTLTDNKTYNIVLKTSSGVIINENYEVTQNHPYGNLPNVEVINSSFIHWILEDGTVINNDTLVALDETHTLTAVVSPVVAPVIEASNSNWTDKDVSVFVKTPGVAEKGIKNYEYLITNSSNPSSEATPTGVVNDSVTVTNTGTNYVYFRTVANDGIKSSWSNEVITRIDKTAPANVNFSNKVVDSSNVTMNVNYTENESSIKEVKCYYGDASGQTTSGTSNNGKCIYPSSAEYAKVCVVNQVGKETCSSSKKLAEYFIKNGNQLVEFDTVQPRDGVASISQGNGYLQLDLGNKNNVTGRGGLITKDGHDFSNMNRGYIDMEMVQDVWTGDPFVTANVGNGIWFQGDVPCSALFGIAAPGNVVDKAQTFTYKRTVYTNEIKHTPRNDSIFNLGKNASSQYAVIKIYNVWFQLKD